MRWAILPLWSQWCQHYAQCDVADQGLTCIHSHVWPQRLFSKDRWDVCSYHQNKKLNTSMQLMGTKHSLGEPTPSADYLIVTWSQLYWLWQGWPDQSQSTAWCQIKCTSGVTLPTNLCTWSQLICPDWHFIVPEVGHFKDQVPPDPDLK